MATRSTAPFASVYGSHLICVLTVLQALLSLVEEKGFIPIAEECSYPVNQMHFAYAARLEC
jgi:hypothetical protein